MRQEIPGLKEQIKTLLQNEYDIQPTEMTFIPVGEESISYKITDGKKIYISKYNADISTFDQTEKTHQLLLELSNNSFIVPPVESKESKTVYPIENGIVSIFPFVEGPMVVEENTDFHEELVGKLTEIITLLYSMTPSIHTDLKKEDFHNQFAEKFSIVMNKAKHDMNKKYAAIAMQNEKKIQGIIEEYSKLGAFYKQHSPKLTLSHGDISGLNIIQITGDIRLIDWDGAMFAPKERDLIFLLDNPNFDKKNYLETIGESHIDSKLISYYKLQWALDSIVLNLYNLATTNINEVDAFVKLAEVKEYLGYY